MVFQAARKLLGCFPEFCNIAAEVQVNGSAVNLAPILTPEVVILALAFGIGVSILFAMWPAWRASKLNVVEALRYE